MITVMIVDSSAVVRSVLQELLQSTADIRVIGAAPAPLFALPKMLREWPDVVITDITMPRREGIGFIKQIIAQRPTAVVVCSVLAELGSKGALEAIDAGAFSFISKTTLDISGFLRRRRDEIIATVRAAALANINSSTS